MRIARTQQIVIDIPNSDSMAWVNVTVQFVDKDEDGNVIKLIDRAGFIHKSADKIAAELYTYFDPVLQKEFTVSGAGVYGLIADAVNKWICKKYDGEIIDGNVIIK